MAAIAGHHIIVDSSGELASLDHPSGWWAAVQNVFLWLLAVSLLAAVGRQVAGFVKSSGQRRQQVKWALAGAAVSVTCGFLALALSGNANPIVSAIGNAAIAGVPALVAAALFSPLPAQRGASLA
jgi:predicted exporter